MKLSNSIIASSLSGFAAAASWGYDTQPWDSMTEYCSPAAFVRQSPIDIKSADAKSEHVAMDTLIGAQGFVEDHFKESSYSVKTNDLESSGAHSVTFSFDQEIGNSQFKCPQFHCHFVDSEHSIDGARQFGECHAVCYDQEKYGAFSEAVKTINGDELAVFGFFIEEDASLATNNAAVDTMISAVNNFNGETFADASIDVQIPVPEDLSKYYRYMGGLTTPNCNPIVQWTVFANSVKITSAQKLEILKWSSGHLIGNNRQVQPMQGREVTCYGCEDKADADLSMMKSLMKKMYLIQSKIKIQAMESFSSMQHFKDSFNNNKD
jgi:carbonic anhydrase